jgi:hypothetical protein
MSGFLDSKQRIIDTIITDEGRRQLASGQMQIRFVTFTDGGSFYAPDVVSGSSDASSRVYLEAASLPQDQITFEADDSGLLMPFKNAQEVQVVAGNLLTGSTLITSSIASLAGPLLESSLNSFQKQQIIGTEDEFFGENNFELSEENIEFTITDDQPFKKGEQKTILIDQAESLFSDKRLANLKNFKFLPPVNKSTVLNAEGSPLGNFRSPRVQNFDLIKEQLQEGLKKIEKSDYCRKIRFIDTSRESNIFAQFFEVENSLMKKLDVIDFGPIENAGKYSVKQAYFVGKLLVDNNGMPTFINIFTLVFE